MNSKRTPRRFRSLTLSLLGSLLALCPAVSRGAEFVPVYPTPDQLAWQDLEYGMFVHFNMATFFDYDYPNGDESPNLFNPTAFDARQWVQVAKSAGMKYIVLTAKHLDGFCIWQTDTTEHSVKNSKWRDGKGDVVKELADACRAEGIKLGLYVAIGNKHDLLFHKDRDYNEALRQQLRELLSRYGEIFEIWYDPATHQDGQIPDYPGFYKITSELQPNALNSSIGDDIRWVGNEDGIAPETLWNTEVIPWHWQWGPAWWPAEADTTIRTYDNGRTVWFWNTFSGHNVRTVDKLLDMYHTSVGRGAVLLLNIGPDTRGLIPDLEAERVRTVWRLITDNYTPSRNLLRRGTLTASALLPSETRPEAAIDANGGTYWMVKTEGNQAWLEADLGKPRRFNRAIMQEMLSLGQRVESYRLEYWNGSAWGLAVEGTTIGHKKIDRFPEVTGSRVRLILKGLQGADVLTLREFGLYRWTDEVPGDANSDSKTDVSDAVATLRFVARLSDFTPKQQDAADANGDGEVNIIDVTLILRKALGLPFA